MSKVDDELTRRLHRAERPVDVDAVFEGLERRRSHRERVRRVQRALLAFAVLAATAGGFLFLRHAFDPDKRDVGDELTPSVANGDIVFARDGEDDRQHIYAARPDGSGLRQITEGSTNDSHPAVSPDGQTVAFAHTLDQGDGAVIATVPIEGGPIEWQTVAYHDVSNPTWSPDGTHIAFIAHATTSADLYVAEVNGSLVRRIDLLTAAGYEPGEIRALVPSHPSWSPDGSWIAFAVIVQSDAPLSSDLGRIRPDGSGFEWLPAETGPHEFAPAWSPDGTAIAFLRTSGRLEDIEMTGGPHEIWTIAPDGGGESLIASAADVSLRLDIAWAPDATSLLVSDGTWISRVDPSPTGDPRVNFARLVKGFAPSWQPATLGSGSATASPEPSVSPSPEPQGKDVGLGFNLCNLKRLSGIDFLGDGTNGAAWTGTKVRANGTCPKNYDDRYGVAADLTGDGLADSWSGETIEYCGGCEPWKAMDLNGDGRKELLVVLDYFSIMHYGVYTFLDVDGRPEIEPFRMGEPGHPEHELDPGKPFTFWVGGDAGLSDWFYCETLPEFWLTGTESPIEPAPGDVTTVHRTHVSLMTDGIAHILFADTYTVPAETHLELPYTSPDHSEPTCGLRVGLR